MVVMVKKGCGGVLRAHRYLPLELSTALSIGDVNDIRRGWCVSAKTQYTKIKRDHMEQRLTANG